MHHVCPHVAVIRCPRFRQRKFKEENKVKKFLAIVLALAIMLGLCACTGGMNVADQDKYGDDGRVQISIGMSPNAKVTDYNDNALTKWLEEQTGCKITFVDYSGGSDVATQISSTIAAGMALPDMLWGVSIDHSTIATYGKEGYFVDMKEYFDDKTGASKNFWDRMENDLTPAQQEYVLTRLINKDTGGIYSIPTIETSLVDQVDSMAYINVQWLDKLGLKKPTNTQELYDVLVAFRDRDPNGNQLADEIPLYGSQKGGTGALVLNWLINMFIYYNDAHTWQDYNGDGQLELVYVQDEFREALKFINKLYNEKLLTTMVYTASSTEMSKIISPTNDVPLCGIFLGHLTAHIRTNSPLLYQYESLKTWGCATEGDIAFSIRGFITETAEKRGVVDECFKMFMTMWSWDGSMRLRYGEKGYNWTDADEGAKSVYGLDATFKLIVDPFSEQSNKQWGNAWCSLNYYAESETAQAAETMTQWAKDKATLMASARKDFDASAAENNPKFLKDPVLLYFSMTSKEDSATSMVRVNVNSLCTSTIKDFVTGSNKKDINNDADWQAFLNKAKELGYDQYQAIYQKCWERQR